MKGSSSQSCFVVLYICYSYSALLVIKSSLCGHGCPHSSVFLDLRTDRAVNRGYVCQLDTHRRRAWHQGFVIWKIYSRITVKNEPLPGGGLFRWNPSSSHYPFFYFWKYVAWESTIVDMTYTSYFKSETFNPWAPLQNTKEAVWLHNNIQSWVHYLQIVIRYWFQITWQKL